MKEPQKPLALTREEKSSQLWHKLEAHWNAKIDALHAQIERDQPENITASLRGRIAEIRASLALTKELPDI